LREKLTKITTLVDSFANQKDEDIINISAETFHVYDDWLGHLEDVA
jgi:hypothetical protein